MPHKHRRVDAYIGQSAPFARPILTHLRKIVHQADPKVEETIKWGCPHFVHGGMLCNMAAFKEHCTFGFWNGAKVLGRGRTQGSAHGQFGRLTSLRDLPADRVLIGYIKKAVRLNESGYRKTSPPRTRTGSKKTIKVPSDLSAALRKNKRALANFEGFSPSHKREYVDWITEAKREETRKERLKTAVQWIAAAKPRYWKYVRG